MVLDPWKAEKTYSRGAWLSETGHQLLRHQGPNNWQL